MREAIFSLADEELEAVGVCEVVSVFRDAGILSLREEECRGNGGLIEAEVRRRIEDKRLSELESIGNCELVSEGGTYVYLVEFTAPNLPETSEQAEKLVGACDPTVGEGGVTATLVGPQETIRELLSKYESAGAEPELHKAGEYEGVDDPLGSLTDRQREMAETAYEMGYYEVPREVSTEELAEELGIDCSTVSEGLRRAEKNLLGRHFSGGR